MNGAEEYCLADRNDLFILKENKMNNGQDEEIQKKVWRTRG
jgi:hypothetical protein